MTPFEKTEKDVRHLGDMIEKQLRLCSDPKYSEFRAVFQGLTLAIRSAKLQVKICRALGIAEEVHPLIKSPAVPRNRGPRRRRRARSRIWRGACARQLLPRPWCGPADLPS